MLSDFIDAVCSESHLRVEEDLGDGFVRLRIEEAQRRQAAQDIRSSEDAVIEMLRNSRDAQARSIFVATGCENGKRSIVVLDDGLGIPASVHEKVFEPCVTSKLDSVHMDKWGIHGRGMALYSIRHNADFAGVCVSEPGLGTSIKVVLDTAKIGEKTDQSTFPQLTLNESGKVAIRGPKNIIRTACEFALEHRRYISVYVGSAAEIVATLYEFGLAGMSASALAFRSSLGAISYVKQLSLCADANELATKAYEFGLNISERTAYRIIEGKVKAVDSLIEIMGQKGISGNTSSAPHKPYRKSNAMPKISQKDLDRFEASVIEAFAELAEAYYFEPSVQPQIAVSSKGLKIQLPLIERE